MLNKKKEYIFFPMLFNSYVEKIFTEAVANMKPEINLQLHNIIFDKRRYGNLG